MSIRDEIDLVDNELTKLLEKRYELVEEVAKAKLLSGAPVFDSAREEAVLERVNGMVSNPAYKEYITGTYSEIMRISKDFQSKYISVRQSKIRKIVLIGMPGCGKTTLGRELAARTGLDFEDSDEAFTKEVGITPGEYITAEGEEAFREAESRIIAGLAEKDRIVVALGGGAVTRDENYEALAGEGTLFVYLRRDKDKLETAGRPLSLTKGVDRLLEEREPLYSRWADLVLENMDVDCAVWVLTKRLLKEALKNRPEHKQ